MSHNLIAITAADFGVDIDLKYATSDNFTGQPVYKKPACFLHIEAAEKLRKAIAIAAAQGFKIRIFDAYRPTEVQQILWNHTPDPDFLAPPERGSAHSRGIAVDITIENSDGILDMGTAFDAFTPLSYHGDLTIPVEAQRNRLLLLGIMTAAGWDCYLKEWWHYQLFNSKNYPLLSDSIAETDLIF